MRIETGPFYIPFFVSDLLMCHIFSVCELSVDSFFSFLIPFADESIPDRIG